MKTITKMIYLSGAILSAGFVACFAVDVPDVNRVTVEKILKASLEHSQLVKAAGQEIGAADARLSRAKAKGLPALDANLQAGHFSGLVDVTLGPSIVIPGIEDRYSAVINLTQPLFTGGQISNQKKSAAFQKQAAKARERETVSDVALQALQTYWGWSKAFYVIESLKASVARIDAHSVDMKNLRQNGLATENNELATEVLLDQVKLKLQEASRAAAVARARIAFLTGSEIPESSVPDKPVVADAETVPAEKDLVAAAITNRAERSVRKNDLESASAGVKASRAGYMPKLYLAAHYEQMRPNNYFFPPEEKWNDDTFVGAALTWNIFDSGLTRAEVKEAQAKEETAKLMLDQTEEQIELEVKEARINLQNAVDRLAVAERARASAEKNLKVVTDQWQNGMMRHTELLDAHSQLTQAEYEVVAGRADMVFATCALNHAVGRLAVE